jgi:hypothetical protein
LPVLFCISFPIPISSPLVPMAGGGARRAARRGPCSGGGPASSSGAARATARRSSSSSAPPPTTGRLGAGTRRGREAPWRALPAPAPPEVLVLVSTPGVMSTIITAVARGAGGRRALQAGPRRAVRQRRRVPPEPPRSSWMRTRLRSCKWPRPVLR